MHSASRRASLHLLWALLLLLAIGCDSRRPNLLLIAVDTLRADHLGAYGYSRATSPETDALFESSIVFDDVQASSAWTLPSFASLMTSLHTATHGCRSFSSRLPGSLTTLAEILRDADYTTAAVVSHHFMDARYGLAQGFDHYDQSLAVGVDDSHHAVSSPGIHERADAWLRSELGTDLDPVQAYPPAPTTSQPTHGETVIANRQLAGVRDELGDCLRCKLSQTRKTIVFGSGNPNADLVFVGEGPGADEDEQGLPFVGRAGKKLTEIIEKGMGLSRADDVYICNIVKCRPPGNRDPEPDEISACKPFLLKQLGAIKPKVIVALGRPASSTLLGRSVAITKERGIWQEFEGVKLMLTFHPSYLLRCYTLENRRAIQSDMNMVLKALGR